MLQAKPTRKLPADVVFVKALPGKMLPLNYKGSIIGIGEDKAVEIDRSLLNYQSRAIFDRAIKENDIELVKGE